MRSTDLLVRTPFNIEQLIDWIAQAKLYVYVKSDIKKLMDLTIRTVFDLCKDGEAEALDKVAQATGISESKLKSLCERVKREPSVSRLLELKNAHALSSI